MADFAPNFTARYRLRYIALGRQHSMLFRLARGVGSAGLPFIIAKAKQILDALAPARYADWAVTSAEYAPEDVDIFAPAGLPAPIVGAIAVPANNASQSTLAISFVGRSVQGQKARLFVYGCEFGLEGPNALVADNFRVQIAENGTILNTVGALNSGNPALFASDNFPVTFYNYANVKYNDHWVKKVR